MFTVRQKTADQKRVLDDVSRRRRQRKALEALESDNFSEDPHADLKMSKKAPKFEEAMEVSGTCLHSFLCLPSSLCVKLNVYVSIYMCLCLYSLHISAKEADCF